MSNRTEEIRARVEKATQGEWRAEYGDDNGFFSGDVEVGIYAPDNAEFIAHARSDIPYLLTELQKVEADRNRYIQRAGNAEGRLEVVEAELTALRQEVTRLRKSLAAADSYFTATALEVVNLREENARLKAALDYGFRLVNDHKGEGDFSLAKFVAMAREALSSSPAQGESDHAGL